jgi:hypothetical protein
VRFRKYIFFFTAACLYPSTKVTIRSLASLKFHAINMSVTKNLVHYHFQSLFYRACLVCVCVCVCCRGALVPLMNVT